MRLHSKIEAKFWTFDPSPPCKIKEEVGEMSESNFRATPMTQLLIHFWRDADRPSGSMDGKEN